MSDRVNVLNMTNPTEVEQLQDAFLFTLSDGSRLLQRSDVEDICPSKELCFEYGNHVRCGPCALRQAEKYGVTPDISQPFSPSEYRLRRRVRAAEAEIDVLKNAFQAVVEAYDEGKSEPAALRKVVGDIVGQYGEWTRKEFDPALITLSDDGMLAYDGIEYDFSDEPSEAVTIVRHVEQWAMDNLTCLPGKRWRVREVSK